MMSRPPASDVKRNPLIPIGCAVFAVLIIPPFIYSVGPEGPIKQDHVVFSTGNHRAYFEDDARYQAFGYPGYCILQPRDQLVVVESAEARSDGTYLAQPIGPRKREFPSCPSQSKLILQSHQITLKPDTWGGVQDTLTRLFSSQ